MTSVHLLHAGYTGEHTASTVAFVRDDDASIVVEPGMVARRSLILDPLAALGVAPEAVTHIFLSHHHPDHTVNCVLFPNAEIVDFWARYRDDLWLDHDGDGYRLSRAARRHSSSRSSGAISGAAGSASWTILRGIGVLLPPARAGASRLTTREGKPPPCPRCSSTTSGYSSPAMHVSQNHPGSFRAMSSSSRTVAAPTCRQKEARRLRVSCERGP